MDTNRKIKLIAVGVAAVAAGGTGVALGAGGGSPAHGPVFAVAHFGYDHGDDLDVAASYLGLTESQLQTQLESGKTLAQIANATSGKSADGLIAALVAAEKQELADAVSSGKLTQAQADAISATLQQRFTDLVNGTFPKGGHGFGFRIAGLDAAATYLGLTEDQLRTQLESGKTLAQIANATNGKSADGLIAALVADAKKHLDEAVAAGKITKDQETEILSDLKDRITELVNGRLPAPPAMHFRAFHFGDRYDGFRMFHFRGDGSRPAFPAFHQRPSAFLQPTA
jgi:polyhydroxyalkanoate synthesis regulator phasin